MWWCSTAVCVCRFLLTALQPQFCSDMVSILFTLSVSLSLLAVEQQHYFRVQRLVRKSGDVGVRVYDVIKLAKGLSHHCTVMRLHNSNKNNNNNNRISTTPHGRNFKGFLHIISSNSMFRWNSWLNHISSGTGMSLTDNFLWHKIIRRYCCKGYAYLTDWLLSEILAHRTGRTLWAHDHDTHFHAWNMWLATTSHYYFTHLSTTLWLLLRMYIYVLHIRDMLDMHTLQAVQRCHCIRLTVSV